MPMSIILTIERTIRLPLPGMDRNADTWPRHKHKARTRRAARARRRRHGVEVRGL